jgi:hypothetical protein
MKRTLLLLMVLLNLTAAGQSKYNYSQFEALKEVAGTNYVVATVENSSKMGGRRNPKLLFIETKTGQVKQVDAGNGGNFGKIEQVKIDSLGINIIIVSAQTVDLDGKKGIDWNDPKQLIVFSTDGKERTQLTDNKFYTQTWLLNKTAGTITIIGGYDVNDDGKYDETDKSEILIYDLKTLKLITKI